MMDEGINSREAECTEAILDILQGQLKEWLDQPEAEDEKNEGL